MYCIHGIHLVNIKLGKLECNANWQTFSLVNIMGAHYLTILIIHMITYDYNLCWCILNLPIEAQVAKLPTHHQIYCVYGIQLILVFCTQFVVNGKTLTSTIYILFCVLMCK